MAISDYLANKILDHILTNSTTPFVTTTTVWAAYHTAAPGKTGTNAPLASCPRVALPGFNAAVSATSSNAAIATVVTSASAAAITHISLWDGSATGTANFLMDSSMTSAGVRILAAGATVVLSSGILRVNLG